MSLQRGSRLSKISYLDIESKEFEEAISKDASVLKGDAINQLVKTVRSKSNSRFKQLKNERQEQLMFVKNNPDLFLETS